VGGLGSELVGRFKGGVAGGVVEAIFYTSRAGGRAGWYTRYVRWCAARYARCIYAK